MPNIIEKTCLFCSKNFEASFAEHNRGNAKYCSSECCSRHYSVVRKSRIKKTNCVCATCSKQFYRATSKNHSKSGFNFCCRICSDKSKIIQPKDCLECGFPTHAVGKKYCSVKCQRKFQYKEYIVSWLAGDADGKRGLEEVSSKIRRYLFEKNNNKCEKCGWNKVHPITRKVPLTINHIDGDCHNNKPSNLELICWCCHSLTPNFGGLNKGSGRKTRREKKKFMEHTGFEPVASTLQK